MCKSISGSVELFFQRPLGCACNTPCFCGALCSPVRQPVLLSFSFFSHLFLVLFADFPLEPVPPIPSSIFAFARCSSRASPLQMFALDLSLFPEFPMGGCSAMFCSCCAVARDSVRFPCPLSGPRPLHALRSSPSLALLFSTPLLIVFLSNHQFLCEVTAPRFFPSTVVVFPSPPPRILDHFR